MPETHDSVLAALMRRFWGHTVSMRHENDEPVLVRHHVLFPVSRGGGK